tara:strand:+ start:222 stop:353 length:132 start_codon:yes stop_codon:yes gene_type:complete
VAEIIVEEIIEITTPSIDRLEVRTAIDLRTIKNQIEINNGLRY